MLFFYVLLFQLLINLSAFPHCSIQIKESKGAIEEVFIVAEKANLFIGRHLLYNRFDFELITQGDLERECYEEQCNFEEAREIFRESKKTVIIQLTNAIEHLTYACLLIDNKSTAYSAEEQLLTFLIYPNNEVF